MNIDAYRIEQPYIAPPSSHLSAMEVLPTLRKLPCDNRILPKLHTLRPSHLHILRKLHYKPDTYQPWTVVVLLEDDNKTIHKVLQYVELPDAL